MYFTKNKAPVILMALLLLITTLLDKINSLLACNAERVNVLRD